MAERTSTEGRVLTVGVAAAEGVERLTAAIDGFDITLAACAEDADTLAGGAGTAAVIVSLDVTSASSARELRRLRALFEGTAVVVVSPETSTIGVRRVLDAAVEGLVLESEIEQALAPTVLAVCGGQVCVPSSSGRQLQNPALTTREKQVLGMVTLGFANSEIAAKLYLAESTVKSHLSSAFAKLGVRSRSEAAALILDPDSALGAGMLRISSKPGEGADGPTNGAHEPGSGGATPWPNPR